MKTILLLAALGAHAFLTGSDPADGARIKAPSLVRLQFAQALAPERSGASLRDAAGHAVPVSTAIGGPAITLIPLRLKPGAYQVRWHGEGADHRPHQGRFRFTVVP
jgi:methionine-rich copper-binding protein CopC